MNGRLFLVTLILAAVIGGGVFLDTRMIPAPSHPIEKSISHDHFLK